MELFVNCQNDFHVTLTSNLMINYLNSFCLFGINVTVSKVLTMVKSTNALICSTSIT